MAEQPGNQSDFRATINEAGGELYTFRWNSQILYLQPQKCFSENPGLIQLLLEGPRTLTLYGKHEGCQSTYLVQYTERWRVRQQRSKLLTSGGIPSRSSGRPSTPQPGRWRVPWAAIFHD